MKKMIAGIFLIAILVFVSRTPVLAYVDIPEHAAYKQSVEDLTAYGIICGTSADTFDPEGDLTRAEFAKMAVMIAGLKQSYTGALFSDVPASHWANGYIGAAALNGILIAYPDGRFNPDQVINYAQAITVTVRLLGYSDDTLNGVWPDSYIKKAEELGITEGISSDAYSPITRADCALLLNNALMTDIRKTSAYSKDTKLIERMGFSVSDECIVIASKNEAPALLEKEVKSTEDTYVTIIDPSGFVSKRGRLVLNEDDEIIHFIPSEQSVEKYTISSIRESSLLMKGGDKIETDDHTIVYYNGEQMTYKVVYDDDDTTWRGKTALVYPTENGDVDYIFIY